MVSALQRARAATPGTQGKPDRGLATLSGSTCTRYQHGCNRMCAFSNMQTNAMMSGWVGAGALSLELFRRRLWRRVVITAVITTAFSNNKETLFAGCGWAGTARAKAGCSAANLRMFSSAPTNQTFPTSSCAPIGCDEQALFHPGAPCQSGPPPPWESVPGRARLQAQPTDIARPSGDCCCCAAR